MNVREFEEIQENIDAVKKRKIQAETKLESAKEQLEKDFGIKSVEEAEQILLSKKKQIETLIAKRDKTENELKQVMDYE